MRSGHPPRISTSQLCIVVQPRAQKAGPMGSSVLDGSQTTWVSAFDHADSFEIDHFDQYFHLIFWLKVNNDTVFEAIVLEYDRYEPPLCAMSCHKYLVVWQDLKNGIFYVNHVLLVILKHIGTFKNVFHILIVQIPGLDRTLHLTKDMNDQMVEFGFQGKGKSWHFAKKRNTARCVGKGCHINSK